MGSVALRVLCSIERAGRWTLSGPSIRRRTGFTLIELMIVIAIIAIIAAIAIPNLLEARKSGNDSSAIGKIRTVASAQLFVRAQGSTYATLGQLGTAGLVEPALGDGAKSGYYFVGSVDPTLGTFELKASPASPNSGSKNFGMKCGAGVPVECEIRESDSVFPDETDPPVPESDGGPADPVPPPAGGVSCGPGPATIFPTNPEQQAAANTALQEFLGSMALGLVETYAPPVAGLVHTLFATAQGAAVAPEQAVLESLDNNGDNELTLNELMAAPFGQFSARNAIDAALDPYGSCEAACLAGGETSASCAASCSGSIASPGEVEGALDGLASSLAFMLDLGIACEDDLPGVPLANLSGDPLSFVAAVFGLTTAVPLLAPPLVGVLALAILATGFRRARRSRANPGSGV